jgi:hypothetical protein
MNTSQQQTCPARVSGQQRALAVNNRRVSAKAHNAGIQQLNHEQTSYTEGNEGPKKTFSFPSFPYVQSPSSPLQALNRKHKAMKTSSMKRSLGSMSTKLTKSEREDSVLLV